MSTDDFDKWVRDTAHSPLISEAHCAALIERVIARAEARPAVVRAPRARLARILGAAGNGWGDLAAAISRFAVPMATAALLGIVVGDALESREASLDFVRLLTASSPTIVDL